MLKRFRKNLTGLPITLSVLLAVVLMLTTILSASAADSNLPGGTSISVEVTTPTEGAVIPEADATIALGGTASIGEGAAVANTLVVYVLDVSGSTTGSSGCGGNLNNDAYTNSILDCEIASAIALNQEAAALGTVGEVGVVVFAGSTSTSPYPSAAAGDVNPTADIQLITGPATDLNNNGPPDVVETLRSARTNTPQALTVFTPLPQPRISGAATDYSAGIQAALQVVGESTMPNKLVIFMSDGQANAGAPVASLQAAVEASGALFNTFAVGNAATITCDTAGTGGRGTLRDVANLSDPNGECFEVGAVAQLPDILPTVLASTLESLELAVDGGAATDISGSAVPALPQNGPANVTYATSTANLAPGSHQLCVIANGSDAGGEGDVTDCVNVTVNAAPLADAGGPYTGDEGSPISLLGSASDVDGPGLTTNWSYTGPAVCSFSAANALSTDFTCDDNGIYTVSLSADDGLNSPTVASATVTVNNVAPTVDAGANQSAAVGATVNLSGTFMDPAGVADDLYEYAWDIDGDSVADVVGFVNYGSAIPASTAFAAPGTYVLTLTVKDKDGDSGSDVLTISVNSPPVCSAAAASLESLWPVDHTMKSINILGVSDPDGDAVTITITSIYQDELTNGLGDGDTSPDGFGIGTETAQVRAERAGNGNGRVYHITFTATDPYGGTCSGLVFVTVPKSQGTNGAAVDDGALYDSTLP